MTDWSSVRTVAADPAWSFQDAGRRGGTRRHYEALAADVIAAMPVARVFPAAEHLWLWAPSSFVLDGTAYGVADAWGFDPKTFVTWVKPLMGTGRWLRNTTEQCVFAVRRGTRAPVVARNVKTHFYAPRGRHSEKPPEFYRHVIERASRGDYVELFARYARPGWSCWGDQVPGGGVAIPELQPVPIPGRNEPATT